MTSATVSPEHDWNMVFVCVVAWRYGILVLHLHHVGLGGRKGLRAMVLVVEQSDRKRRVGWVRMFEWEAGGSVGEIRVASRPPQQLL